MSTSSVCVVTRADQLGTLSNRQLSDSLVPSADNFTLSDLELERLSAGARRIEDCSVVEGSGVMDRHGLSVLGESGA